jgi:hypothetical protein
MKLYTETFSLAPLPHFRAPYARSHETKTVISGRCTTPATGSR